MNLFDSQLAAFVLATLVLTITPGVDTVIVIRNVLRGGRRDGVYTALGICTGLFVHALLSACGISMILFKSSYIFNVVKTLGSIYLIWLGMKTLYSTLKHKDNAESIEETFSDQKPYFHTSFKEGLFSNILNPKPAIFCMAFYPQFILPTDPVFAKSIFLATIQFCLGVIWLVTLSMFLNKVRFHLTKSTVKRSIDSASGTILIALGLKLGFEKT